MSETLVSNIENLVKRLKSTRNEIEKIRIQAQIIKKGRILADKHEKNLTNAIKRGYNNWPAIENVRRNIKKLRSPAAQRYINLANLDVNLPGDLNRLNLRNRTINKNKNRNITLKRYGNTGPWIGNPFRFGGTRKLKRKGKATRKRRS